MKYLFGPVNSRRLGRSLGIDLVPYKTCTLDCVYCECGVTTDLTLERREYVPTAEVISELDEYIKDSDAAGRIIDVITFSGAGEPTLHSGIGEIITHIKREHASHKVVLLTNGTLLWREDVRREIKQADVVMPSLDAVSEKAFETILRPCRDISPDRIIDGMIAFRKDFAGALVIEIFIVPGVNDTDAELALLKDACLKIKPDEIHLNSLDRPPAENWVRQADIGTLKRIEKYFSPLNVRIIGKPAARPFSEYAGNDAKAKIVDTLKRRPSTISDLATAIGIPEDEIRTILGHLLDEDIVAVETLPRGEFYRVKVG